MENNLAPIVHLLLDLGATCSDIVGTPAAATASGGDEPGPGSQGGVGNDQAACSGSASGQVGGWGYGKGWRAAGIQDPMFKIRMM